MPQGALSRPAADGRGQARTVFYAEQSEVLANFIRILGLTLSIIFTGA